MTLENNKKKDVAVIDRNIHDDNSSYEIHELCSMVPFEDEDYERIKVSIERNGLDDPIVVDERGVILDGKLRYRACQETGRPVKTVPWEGQCGTPREYILSKATDRRQLSKLQVAALIIKFSGLEDFKTEAKERQRLGREKVPDPEQQGKAVELAAQKYGVNAAYLRDLDKLNKKAPPRLDEVVNGSLRLEGVKRLISEAETVSKGGIIRQTDMDSPEDQPIIIRMEATSYLLELDFIDLLITKPPRKKRDEVFTFAQWIRAAIPRIEPTGRAFIFIDNDAKTVDAYLRELHMQDTFYYQLLSWKRKITPRNTKKSFSNSHTHIIHIYGRDSLDLNTDKPPEKTTVHEFASIHEGTKYFVNLSTKEGDLVVDPFAGSGKVLLAAASLNRRARGAEINNTKLEKAEQTGCKIERSGHIDVKKQFNLPLPEFDYSSDEDTLNVEELSRHGISNQDSPPDEITAF